MQSRSSTVDVAFVAAHLLTPALGSGGDVLFANVALQAARLRPDWHICAIAPDFACDGLAPFFRTVVPLPSHPGEAERVARHPRDVALVWARRVEGCARAAERLGARVLHATGDFFVDVVPAARAARRTGAHFTGVVHHLNAPPFRRRNELVAATASWLLQKRSLRTLRARAERIFLLGETTCAALVSRGFSATQLAVVGAGIDLDRFALAPPPASRDRVLWVHRLEPTKGVFDLPRLAALLPESVTIDVVGRGPRAWRDRLDRDLQREGVAHRVRVHGYLDDAALADFYAGANAFVSCSYEEGWAISVAEALACGIPCVAYALPTYAEVFGDAVDTAAVGDVRALAERLVSVLRAPDTIEARAARRAAVGRYSFAGVAARQVAIFEGLIGAG